MPNLPFSEFSKNVYINCPFDHAYRSLLRPLLFTIVYFGFNPKIASERSDSAEQRIDKICELIASSKYSIHDLSRLKSERRNEYARHNMPFELGIDYGSRKLAGNHFAEKKFLVLEQTKRDFSRALSDLAGIDVKPHENDPQVLIRAVRNWFIETVGLKRVKPASAIFSEFIDFMADFDAEREKEGFTRADIYEMPSTEFISFIRDWLHEDVPN